jgi:tetratricopeptide (TPR) repeat protein
MNRENTRMVDPKAEPSTLPPANSFRLPAVLLLAITMIAYQPVWRAGFIWDDDNFLTDHHALTGVDFKSASALPRIWLGTAAPDYYPMTFSLWWLESRLWGVNYAPGFHVVNVLIHALSSILLWRALLRLNIPGAWLAAALFAVHPVNVESAAWITEGKNTLCMLFFAATLLFWLKFEDTGNSRWHELALACGTLGFLSKSAIAPLPLVLLGMAWWRRGRVDGRDLRRVLPFCLMAAAICAWMAWFHHHYAIGSEVVRTDSLGSRLAGAGWAVWFYLYKAILPLNLMFVYPRWRIDAGKAWSYLPLLLLAAALVVCWRCRQRWGKGLFFGLSYFVVMLLPILGFLNIYYMRYSLVADHWQYFAIPGPMALAAAVLMRRPPVAAVVLLALGALTWRQCGMYRDAETLWRTTAQRNPDCWLACLNLGAILDKEGKTDAAIALYRESLRANPAGTEARLDLAEDLAQAGKLEDAISQFQKVLHIAPANPEAHNGLGDALLQQGKVDEAIAEFVRALKLQPEYSKACNNLGSALLQKGHVNQALECLQKAVTISPDLAEAHYNLGNAFVRLGRMNDAIERFQRAVQLKPAYAQAHLDLGNALLQTGRPDEAIAHYQKALQAKPAYFQAQFNLGNVLLRKGDAAQALAHFQEALQLEPNDVATLNTLAWLLATCPDASLRNGDRAVQLAQEASQATDGSDPMILQTLAAALAEAGRFDDATTTARRALALAEAQSNAKLADQLRFQINLYAIALPFHLPAPAHSP